jgi:putative restriction endonuclease
MPSVSAARLTQSILNAFVQSNATAIHLPGAKGNPRRFIVQTDSSTFELWIYLWTLTHGGGAARPKLEYRIQLTGVSSPLQMNPLGGPTLLLGYEPNIGCFAGFDVTKHFVFSTNSPSIQIPITTLNDALQDGMAFVRKGNDEIAIGIRPDQLLTYALNAPALHEQGADVQTTALLSKAVTLEEIVSADLNALTLERQRVVSTVSRLSRNVNFRRKVTIAYDRRCAVTRMQLDLIDAAHILPVGIDGSTDEVSNGLCLSPTYHRAFDRALIYLDENLTMRLNPAKVTELETLGLTGGLGDFSGYLNLRIHLPSDRNQWPSAEMIRRANVIRGI